MIPIGGYFELELGDRGKNFPHAYCSALNSGRHALEFILRQLNSNVKRIYIPYYTCDSVLEPLYRLSLNYKFYHVNENLEIEELPTLKDGDYLIANNYFGIKDNYMCELFVNYGDKLIVDNSQAFFAPERLGMKSFYSPRKFVGVPDGGFASTTITDEIDIVQDYSTDRASFLLRRIDCGATDGYKDFQISSQELSKISMRRMSNLTYRILSSIDFDEIMYRRRRNFEILHSELASSNEFLIPDISTFKCPMVYPFMTVNLELRKYLIDNQIFIATYWPNIFKWCDANSIEYKLASHIMPLPIDQRYSDEDMEFIVNTIKSFRNSVPTAFA